MAVSGPQALGLTHRDNINTYIMINYCGVILFFYSNNSLYGWATTEAKQKHFSLKET